MGVMVRILQPPMTCLFCSPSADIVVVRNSMCYARWDRNPVSRGHMLVVPFRHVQDFFALSSEEKYAILDLVSDCKRVIEETETPAGYNIGFNVGAAAGQTVRHCHCHVIPRYAGDANNPSGGVECSFHGAGTINQNTQEQFTGSGPAPKGGPP